jgi:aryl-alcohol dehydrogenase-like predicted oxidoreductase
VTRVGSILGLPVSRLAFGTASLYQLGAAEQEALLKAALDAGITHFDTSPYYGYGLAERTLNCFAQNRSVSIATKVGLYPPGGAEQSRLSVLARKIAGKALPALSKPSSDMSVAAARASLDASRRRLGRDRIDLVLLHEPVRATFQTDEWQRFIEEQKGRIGAFGVAGEVADVQKFVGIPLVQVIQTRDSGASHESAPLRQAGRAPDITFGHIAALADRTGASQEIEAALLAHPDEIVLVSTRSQQRLAELASALRSTRSPS